MWRKILLVLLLILCFSLGAISTERSWKTDPEGQEQSATIFPLRVRVKLFPHVTSSPSCSLLLDSKVSLAAPLYLALNSFRYIYSSQYPEREGCLVRHIGPPHPGSGFASSLQFISHQFMNVVSEISPPLSELSVSGWAYGCGAGGDWDCFEPLSVKRTTTGRLADPARPCHGKKSALSPALSSAPTTVNGHRWWAHVQAYVFTPSLAQRRRLQCRLAELGIAFSCKDDTRASLLLQARMGSHYSAENILCGSPPQPTSTSDVEAGCLSVGLHVRLGDRMEHDKQLYGLNKYVAAVAALTKLGLRLCLAVVATDDADVLQLAQQALSSVLAPGARIVVLRPRVPRPDTSKTKMVEWIGQQSIDIRNNATEDMIDVIAILSETNVFVGICMSQIARMIAAIQYVKGVAVHAPVAVDKDECLSFQGHSPAIDEGWFGLKDFT